MKDRAGTLIRAVVILIGLGILVYPSLSEFLQQKNASRAVAEYDDTVRQTEHAQLELLLEQAQDYNSVLASEYGVKASADTPNGNSVTLDSYGDLLNIDGDGMIGYISIPSLNTTDRIFHNTDEAVLQAGIGHLKSTSLPVGGENTHVVLMGHRGLPTAELFTDIDKLSVGDRFYIKVLDRTLCYTVDQIETVLPNEMEDLSIESGEDYTTLVTCTPYGVNSHRLLVRGVRTPYDEASDIPVYEISAGSFWTKLPAQYRHMLIGAGVIIAFLILRFMIGRIKKPKDDAFSG